MSSQALGIFSHKKRTWNWGVPIVLKTIKLSHYCRIYKRHFHNTNEGDKHFWKSSYTGGNYKFRLIFFHWSTTLKKYLTLIFNRNRSFQQDVAISHIPGESIVTELLSNKTMMPRFDDVFCPARLPYQKPFNSFYTYLKIAATNSSWI